MSSAAKFLALYEAGVIDKLALNNALHDLSAPAESAKPSMKSKLKQAKKAAAAVIAEVKKATEQKEALKEAPKAAPKAVKKVVKKSNKAKASAQSAGSNLDEMEASARAAQKAVEAEAEAERALLAEIEEAASFYERKAKEASEPTWALRGRLNRERGRWKARDAFLPIPAGYPGAGDPLAIGNAFRESAVAQILSSIDEVGGVKVMLGMTCGMSKERHGPAAQGEDDAGRASESISRYGNMMTFTNADPVTIRMELDKALAKINEEFEKFTQNGSGWVIDRVEKLDLHVDKYRPGRGGSYLPTPGWMGAKKATINVKNNDHDCFKYALTAAIDRPETNPQRVTYYKRAERANMFDLKGIEMPAPATNTTFQRFEKQNPEYSLIVYRCPTNSTSRDDLCTTYYSPHNDRRQIALVMLYDPMSEEGVNSHYITVTNINALLRYDDNNEAHCLRCLHTFAGANARENLERHQRQPCDIQRIELPIKGENDILHFKDFEKTLDVPYAIYLDFESSLVSIPEEEGRCGEHTQRVNKHVANSFAHMTIGPDGEQMPEFTMLHRGPKAGETCLTSLLYTAKMLKKRMQSFPEPPVLTPEQEMAWASAETCHICGKGGMIETEFRKMEEKEVRIKKDGEPYKTKPQKRVLLPKCRVRDHCHITGEFRGAAHSACNLAARTNYKIPVFVHNLKGYDAHLLVSALGYVDDKVSVIATNTEKYVSFSVGDLVFKDSCQFLQAKLETCAKNLPKDGFKQTSILAKEYDVELSLFQRKGIYPYSWVDSDEKFAALELPPIQAFHSDLDNEPCREADYEHAQNVWKLTGCKNFGDYHDLYLKLDVALLADIFQSFRSTMKKSYGLDPAHYFTLPGFAWSALFKMTGQKLQLLSDIDMFIAVEKSLRGGVCAVSHRHSKANNPRVAGYNDKLPRKWLRYDDANNLYGWAMSQRLPVGGFRWGDITKWSEARILRMDDDAKYGAFLCVDLEYPREIHDEHNDYPLCPERTNVPKEWMSQYQRGLLGDTYADCEKLVPNLRNKTEYWIHYRNLKFALNHGLKLKSIHQVIEFRQEAWMKPFIDFNTSLRSKATNDFEKDLYKLMNNACFGKTMENMRARRDIQVLRTESLAFKRWVAEPTYRGRKFITNDSEFYNDLVIAERAFSKVKLFKPIYVGSAVLDLSKLHMWSFWYDYIKPKYGQDVRLCYTDTDSLIYEITSETDPTFDFVGTKGSMFDTSDYPAGHPQQSNDNKKVLGKFKDEAMGVAISEFVGLRPKLYAIRLDSGEHQVRGDKSIKLETKKSKGTKKSVVAKEIKFDHYLQTLETRRPMSHSQMSFKSDCHQVYTTKVTKTSLSALDTKRYILDDGIKSRTLFFRQLTFVECWTRRNV